MARRGSGRFLPLGAMVLIPALAGAALTQSLPSQPDRFPPAAIAPVAAVAPPSHPSPPPIRPVAPTASDMRLESSELGFERGVGPAVGRIIAWRGADYSVVAVAASDGGPTFSGGSRHVIAAEGRGLLVSLRLVDPGNNDPFTTVAAR